MDSRKDLPPSCAKYAVGCRWLVRRCSAHDLLRNDFVHHVADCHSYNESTREVSPVPSVFGVVGTLTPTHGSGWVRK